MSGGEVAIMEKMLDFVGYSLGSYKDDYFGWVTTKALKRFQGANNLDVDGIYGINTKKALEEVYSKKKEQPIAVNAYRKIRMYDSDIHIYKTQPQDKVRVEIGNQGVLEKLSNIFKPAKAKINAGFFGGGKEHLGMLIREGLYYYPPTSNFIDFIYYKDGSTEIKNLDGYDGALLSSFQNEAH
jgi:peptidoglycan hydrolase-like protein with peptidoglycan-binding domain